MKVTVYFNWQIGLMVCLGKTYENRMYISVDIPFFVIQIFWFKQKNKMTHNSDKLINDKN